MGAPAHQTAVQGTTPIRRVTPMLRNALVVSSIVLGALGLDLTLAPTNTAKFFSWGIAPPLTAQTLGAFYLTALVLLLLSIRGWVWARVRVVLPGGILFSAAAFVATLIHLDKFNFDKPGLFGKVVAWVWTVAYLVLPPVLLIALRPQSREPGVDPPMEPAPRWLRTAAGAAGIAMVGVATLLWIVPNEMNKVWPWALTPLTARVLGAWTGGLGLVFLLAAREGSRTAMEAPAVGMALYGLFELLALARFGGDVSWSEAGAWIYVAFLVAVLLAGLAGSARLIRREPAPAAAPA
jgi:hypothetical protein